MKSFLVCFVCFVCFVSGDVVINNNNNINNDNDIVDVSSSSSNKNEVEVKLLLPRQDFEGSVVIPQLPDKMLASPTFKNVPVRIVLNGGEHVTYLKIDNTFIFHDLPVGSYLLEVQSVHFQYPTYRVDIRQSSSSSSSSSSKDKKLPKVRYADSREEISYPPRLMPFSVNHYYDEREGFNVMSIFGNPMVLMVLFSMVMAFVMPKMMDNMDPEEVKRIKEAQKNPFKMFQQQ